MPDLSELPRKATLRAALLNRRRALPAPSLEDAATRVVAELAALVRQVGPHCLAGYVPVGAEPGGPGLADALADMMSEEGRVLLPVMLPDLDLDWAVYHGPYSLTPGPHGLREPSGRRLGPEAIATAEMVVVPAVAVDRRGARLGRGGGSYDRALARVAPQTLVVALLHDGEVVDEVPDEPHDRRVGALITPGDGLVMLPA
ncbi:5-formyltetrahydrofolate cyclo-ligase [Phytohabitans sp. ZYX-F-186]|uniref:5-formyltetrahydrofolate cyclo-ligase n=1 Tax=Phytohabitans maris TaxID=3071409 RepID=A0ABU0ZWR7_9ACTN|nr:5-formyltetrahydrofolate cyclo-ligase [Phytohabitans sp. ZYX-F-186]MDQ7910937.1 5-formyltetrahydrofolate cyclo-ligase [Phytohabitans sp. ZYX-F-186]